MKLFIVISLASVALATPLVQPVVMPEAPLPEFEDKPYVPMIEPVAIKPLFVPQEIIEALKLVEAQVPSDAQAVFEAMEQTADAEVVHVVEYVMYETDAEQAAAVAEIPADAVNFVDVAEDIESEVAEELDAPVEEIPADAVNFVDVAENIDSENAAPAIEAMELAGDADVVHVVDYVVYENEADHVVEKAAPAAEEIPADAVHFVDVAESIDSEIAEEEVNADEIIPEAVHFVDNAENIEAVAGNVEEVSAVKVVDVAPVADIEKVSAVKVVDVAPVADNDFPRYPGKIYDNPMLR